MDSVDLVSLHWSDAHYPFQDERAVNVLYAAAQAIQPHELYAQGDIVDFWQISRFRPPLEHKLGVGQVNLQDTITQAGTHLATMAVESNATKRVFLSGNHEDRWDRMLGDIQRDSRMRAILALPHIRDSLDLPWALGLKGWEYHPYIGYEGGPEAYITVRDRLVLLHGYRSNKWCTRGTLEDFGKSVLFGHAHVIQNWTQQDLKGTDTSYTMGCLCSLKPHWKTQPNWHQGFTVVTWKLGAEKQWFFNVEQVRIHNGTALWRDHVFTA
jgi:hypothetical protein